MFLLNLKIKLSLNKSIFKKSYHKNKLLLLPSKYNFNPKNLIIFNSKTIIYTHFVVKNIKHTYESIQISKNKKNKID
jgi:hypothetical protein